MLALLMLGAVVPRTKLRQPLEVKVSVWSSRLPVKVMSMVSLYFTLLVLLSATTGGCSPTTSTRPECSTGATCDR